MKKRLKIRRKFYGRCTYCQGKGTVDVGALYGEPDCHGCDGTGETPKPT